MLSKPDPKREKTVYEPKTLKASHTICIRQENTPSRLMYNMYTSRKRFGRGVYNMYTSQKFYKTERIQYVHEQKTRQASRIQFVYESKMKKALVYNFVRDENDKNTRFRKKKPLKEKYPQRLFCIFNRYNLALSSSSLIPNFSAASFTESKPDFIKSTDIAILPSSFALCSTSCLWS